MWGAARVLVAGATSFQPCSGRGAGYASVQAGGSSLDAGGLGASGGQEAVSREFLARPLPHWARGSFLCHSLGLGCWGPSAGRGSTAG